MKVLIADDEQKVCALIKHLIDWDALNMEVIAFAHDGKEAIKVINELKPDIVITDIRMPGFNGLEVIREIKDEQPQIEFIIISGFRQFEYAKKGLQYGVSNYLLKPVNQEELTHTLAKVQERLYAQSKQAHQNAKFKKMDKENKKRVRKDWLTNWVLEKHKPIEMQSLEELNKQYHYQFQEDIFRIAVLKIDGVPSEQIKSMHFYNKIEWLLSNYLLDCYDFEYIFHEGKYIILLNYSSYNHLKIKSHLQNILNELLEDENIFKGFSVTIGLDPIHTGLIEVNRGFERANWALAQRLIRGTNQIIMDQEESGIVVNELMDDFSKHFFHAIEINDELLFNKRLNELQDKMFSQKYLTGMEILRNCKEVFNLYLVALKRLHFPPSGLEELSTSFFSEIENLGKGDQVFKYLIDTLTTSFKYKLQEKDNTDSKPIALAKKYIAQNFTKPITLEMVSNEVGFSNAYFSTMFKEKTGENFSEYLFKMRMEEAKRQLRDTQNSVAVICENVGYLDLKHFTKGFKKYTGLRPRDYRKLYA